MKLSRYKITSNKVEGFMLLVYKDARLYSMLLEFKQHLNSDQFNTLIRFLPDEESQLFALTHVGLIVSKENTNDKIALFCKAYEHYKGIKYKVNARDSGTIKTVDVNEGLMKVYFESDNWYFKDKQCVKNYCMYYNYVLAEMAGAIKKYPDYWSAEVEKKLTDPTELMAYRAHLKALGWIKKQDGTGREYFVEQKVPAAIK